MNDRREFIKKTALASAAIYLGGVAMASNKKFYIPGLANDTINIAVIGLNGRAEALVEAMAGCSNVHVSHICDVDSVVLEKHKAYCKSKLGYTPETESDFRKLLENKDIDAVAIATPEHWHAPMAIMALQAGKHVYVEKPCSHNLFENELLVAAQKKYGKIVQMGNQQRSALTSALAVKEISEGIIGKPYYGKAWYSNSRKPIGIGNKIKSPDTLNWDLWQGPAPRESFRDNIHPYNWHWFKAWGTGEIHNNGTHEIDICRWAMGLKYPTLVSSTGGRFHASDDWQFFDTQLVNYEFEGKEVITWEGLSCNGLTQYGNRGRGSIIQGTKGSVLLDRGGYILYDINGNVIKEVIEKNQASTNTADTKGFDLLTLTHMQNFINAIRISEPLHSPIQDASVSTHLCHLGNIAQFEQKSLEIDNTNGHILGNEAAVSKHWEREYEKGWEPSL
jgi:predicted dehydrogenase